MSLTHSELFEFLEEKYLRYNHPAFIESDPISIPHLFERKEDIEIAGFLTATFSWGNRASILKDANRLFGRMGCTPYEFIVTASPSDFEPFRSFYHRTFNGEDCLFFLEALKNIYRNEGGLEQMLTPEPGIDLAHTITIFRTKFLSTVHAKRSEKHIADPAAGSAAKRILMFLRWMVRNDNRGVDFGIWRKMDPSILMCPIDVHSGNVARKLGLLSRKSNDWQAVEELTANLRTFDPSDPVKYDFALFGLGVFEHF
jgi:uncharacterized protein (TIGR02757 family)